jgi:hypothetical protein
MELNILLVDGKVNISGTEDSLQRGLYTLHQKAQKFSMKISTERTEKEQN